MNKSPLGETSWFAISWYLLRYLCATWRRGVGSGRSRRRGRLGGRARASLGAARAVRTIRTCLRTRPPRDKSPPSPTNWWISLLDASDESLLDSFWAFVIRRYGVNRGNCKHGIAIVLLLENFSYLGILMKIVTKCSPRFFNRLTKAL